jgi:hypothetical protein
MRNTGLAGSFVVSNRSNAGEAHSSSTSIQDPAGFLSAHYDPSMPSIIKSHSYLIPISTGSAPLFVTSVDTLTLESATVVPVTSITCSIYKSSGSAAVSKSHHATAEVGVLENPVAETTSRFITVYPAEGAGLDDVDTYSVDVPYDLIVKYVLQGLYDAPP